MLHSSGARASRDFGGHGSTNPLPTCSDIVSRRGRRIENGGHDDLPATAPRARACRCDRSLRSRSAAPGAARLSSAGAYPRLALGMLSLRAILTDLRGNQAESVCPAPCGPSTGWLPVPGSVRGASRGPAILCALSVMIREVRDAGKIAYTGTPSRAGSS